VDSVRGREGEWEKGEGRREKARETKELRAKDFEL
jgi:hypothetical protein